jgi:hypothetical protein
MKYITHLRLLITHAVIYSEGAREGFACCLKDRV